MLCQYLTVVASVLRLIINLEILWLFDFRFVSNSFNLEYYWFELQDLYGLWSEKVQG